MPLERERSFDVLLNGNSRKSILSSVSWTLYRLNRKGEKKGNIGRDINLRISNTSINCIRYTHRKIGTNSKDTRPVLKSSLRTIVRRYFYIWSNSFKRLIFLLYVCIFKILISIIAILFVDEIRDWNKLKAFHSGHILCVCNNSKFLEAVPCDAPQKPRPADSNSVTWQVRLTCKRPLRRPVAQFEATNRLENGSQRFPSIVRCLSAPAS